MIVSPSDSECQTSSLLDAENLQQVQERLPSVIVDEQPSPSHETSEELSHGEGTVGGHTVPTIMLSNSTVAVPLSLESSQSLAPPPLAVRRGRTGPPPLPLPSAPTTEMELYPGIYQWVVHFVCLRYLAAFLRIGSPCAIYDESQPCQHPQ